MIKRQTESINEIKQNERKQKGENMVEDIDLGRFFGLATSNKINANNLNFHEIKNELFKITQVILS